MALNDVKHQRELAEIEKADEYGKKAHVYRMEYAELLEEYDGKKICDIPLEVIQKAEKLLKLARAADKKYMEMLKSEEF